MPNSQFGRTAIMYASKLDTTVLLDEILAADIPPMVDWTDHEGQSALHHACSAGAVEAALTLLAYTGVAKAARKDNKGHTPLDCAFRSGHDEVYEVLKECTDMSLPHRPPAPKQNNSSKTCISMHWGEVIGSKEFKVQRAEQGAASSKQWTTVCRDARSAEFTDSPPDVGQAYVYRVAASNEYGWGPFSRPSDFMRIGANSAATAEPSSETRRPFRGAGARVLSTAPCTSRDAGSSAPAATDLGGLSAADEAENVQLAAVAGQLQTDLMAVQVKLKKVLKIVKQFGLPTKFVKELSGLELRQTEQALLIAAQRVSDERVKRCMSAANGQQKECVICLGELKTVVLLPCKHLCLCDSCAASFFQQARGSCGVAQLESQTSSICPVCRQQVDSHLRVYR